MEMDPRMRQAFALWTTAQPAVSAFLHALVGDRVRRDELLQDVATRVLESFHLYDPSRPFLPWTLTIARRAASDARRKDRRFPIALPEAAEQAFARAIDAVAERDRDSLDHLAGCLQELRDQQREICDLRYRAEMTPARIASMLGLAPNTVSKSLQRIREQLRACIESRRASVVPVAGPSTGRSMPRRDLPSGGIA